MREVVLLVAAVLLAGCGTTTTAGRESECRASGGTWIAYYDTAGDVRSFACARSPLRAGKDAV